MLGGQEIKPLELEPPKRDSNEEPALESEIERERPANRDEKNQFRRQPDRLPFVFRIPHKLRMENESAYSPQLVSIGPLHYRKRPLIQMESNKLRYMKSFLSRNANNYDDVYNRCIKEIQSREDSVRNFYAEDVSLTSSELAHLLVVDGSFILELFMGATDPNSDMKFKNDPNFDSAWGIPSLCRDLILLENQIPFFIVQHLHKEVIGTDFIKLMMSAFDFFYGMGLIGKTTFEHGRLRDSTGQHLLDILRLWYVPDSIRIEDDDAGRQKLNWQYTRQATALTELGVKFQCLTSENLYNIEFNKMGIFKIPKLIVHENTEVFFRNLIALEQLCYRCPQYITSYALLIGCLVENDEDVKILEQKKILEVTLGPGENVSSMLKNLCKGVSLRDFQLAEICSAMDKFCENHLTKYRAAFNTAFNIREFRVPYLFLYLIGTIIVVSVLPLIQTIYAVLSYYKQQ